MSNFNFFFKKDLVDLGIQFGLKFIHLQDKNLGLIFRNLGPLIIGDKISSRDNLEAFRFLM